MAAGAADERARDPTDGACRAVCDPALRVDDATLLSAAVAALTPTSGPVTATAVERLPGSPRTAVLRALVHRDGTAPQPVVIKTAAAAGETGPRETAALRLLSRAGVPAAVWLIADGGAPPVLVLADLGRGPTLVDRLVGTDPEAAERAVLLWARALGEIQAATADRAGEFAAELEACAPWGAPPLDTTPALVAGGACGLERVLPRLGVVPSAGALDELRGVAGALDCSAGGPAGLAPGDTCPSNAVEVGDRMVLLDFEGAEHRHLAWEAAYLRVPWPTCWCSPALPEPLVERALEQWRQAVESAFPQVRTPTFARELRLATAAWAAVSLAWLLPLALDGEREHPDPVRRGATTPPRPALQHRAALVASFVDDLPALAELGAQVGAAAMAQWGHETLPMAPALV